MIGVLSCCLFDIAAYLLAFLLVVPYLDSFHQGLIAVEYQFTDTSFVFAYQLLYVITIDEQRYMLAQRHGDGIRCIGFVLLQYLWDRFLVPSFQQTQLCREVIIVPWLKAYFLYQIFGVFLFIVHAQPFRNIVDSRSLHLGAIPLLLHGTFPFSSHFMRNSFSSLIWSSISLNSGVFITSAFRCFLMTFVRYRRHASLLSSVTNGGHCSS